MLIFLTFLALLSFARTQTLAVGEGEAGEILSRPLLADDDFQCKPSSKPLNRFHFRGTSLGGWLVLEPWITPSLFYQFLGATEKWGDQAKDHVGLDCYTFCTALRKEEANRQLRQHWSTWVTEGEIANLAAMGVETLRIPVADWMFQPYEPFVGCWDGAIDELNRGLALIQKYNLTAIIDLHALRGSQVRHCLAGLEHEASNLSLSVRTVWIIVETQGTISGWMEMTPPRMSCAIVIGRFAAASGRATTILQTRTSALLISLTLRNLCLWSIALLTSTRIILQWWVSSQVGGLNYNSNCNHLCSLWILVFPYHDTVNEPLDSTPLGLLQAYYWRTYQLVQLLAPHWITLLHDSFRLTLDVWGHHGVVLPATTGGKKSIRGSEPVESSDASKSTGSTDSNTNGYNGIAEDLSAVSPLSFTPAKAFMRYCDKYAVDTHRYLAWANDAPMQHFVNAACMDGDYFAALEARGIPIIVGEWSLATDNCILWLNGLNDNGTIHAPLCPCKQLCN